MTGMPPVNCNICHGFTTHDPECPTITTEFFQLLICAQCSIMKRLMVIQHYPPPTSQQCPRCGMFLQPLVFDRNTGTMVLGEFE